jgi:hypothetical protein
MDAIRSTAERILDGPVLDESAVQGLAKLDVPLSLLTDKMVQSGEKARSKGTPIASIRYFAKPLQEFAAWHTRRLDSDTSDNRGESVSLLMAQLSESAEYRASIVADDPDREHEIWLAAYRKTQA